MNLIPAVCPQCGAKLKLPEGTRKTSCQFCGTEFMVDTGEVVVIHKEDVEGKAARLLSVAEKYWDTLKFQEMHDACKQLLELDPDNPVGWLYNAVSANGIGNMVEFERSMDEARKLSAKKMGTAESKFFAQKVDWAYNNLANNILKHVTANDFGNIAAYGHMMVWMKPESPLGWWYRGYALAWQAKTQAAAARKKAGGQAVVALGMAKEAGDALKQAWLLYDKNPNDEFSRKLKEVVGKQLWAARWGRVMSIIGAIMTGITGIVMSAVFYYIFRGADMLHGDDAIFALIFIGIPLLLPVATVFTVLGSLLYLLTKNERNFI